ncbi:hypothetical protein [Sporisorium scitamineum]|uniref:Uncharacterized protein n=1 Tax=Sporisorium scitamineum TaxID=49012 RepID=A0A0F7RWG3_9BASI|nr:hypothetical protein [Sporisorium scitamineum]
MLSEHTGGVPASSTSPNLQRLQAGDDKGDSHTLYKF